jgi:hypothetical protein
MDRVARAGTYPQYALGFAMELLRRHRELRRCDGQRRADGRASEIGVDEVGE